MRLPASRLFGTDGVRGIANRELTAELALGLGRVFGLWLARDLDKPEVMIARDTRLSGPMLASAVEAGLTSAGANAVDCGILPTPALGLLTARQWRAGAVMLSASHNPPQFNGIKLLSGEGKKLPDEVEDELEALLRVYGEQFYEGDPDQVGLLFEHPEAGDEYLDLLFQLTPLPLKLTGLKVALDCGFGAAFQLAHLAFERAGAEVVLLNAQADGARINAGCGALHPQQVGQAVLDSGADFGVAFDGDADRAMFVDEAGVTRDGDHIKYLLAADALSRSAFSPPVVVGTVMSNLGLELALRELGVELVRTPVGDRYVAETMAERGAVLGGEQSGHIIFAEHGLGDGIYTALRVAEVVSRTGKPLSELAAPVQKVPQVLINVPLPPGYDWQRSEPLQQALAEWQATLEGKGRLLLRPSGTEPLLRVMVEALDKAMAYEAAGALAETITSEVPEVEG